MRLNGPVFLYCLFFCFGCSFLTSCTNLRSIVAICRTTEQFHPCPADKRILCEPGAEEYAQKIVPLLPEAIQKVETNQYVEFIDMPEIYICESIESCYKHTGSKAPAVVLDKIFLSPLLFTEKRPLDRYLAHELSHLHLRQRIGRSRAMQLPTWFSEGLAEVVSGGATASRVSDKEAFEAIKRGDTFLPDEGRSFLLSFLFPKTANYWNLDNGMFYRQCMLFVNYLRSENDEEFRGMLISVLNGNSFEDSWREHFRDSLPSCWNSFLNDVNKG